MFKAVTSQQEAFAQGVASGLSQSEAYRKAYPSSLKWKDDSVHNKSSALMRHALVRARVAELAKKAEEVFSISTAKLLQESHRLAHSDVGKTIGPGNKILLPHELDADTRAAVASFKIDEYGRIEYKFWDKNSAIERLFKHKGLFQVDHQQKVDAMEAMLGRLNGNVVGVVHEKPLDADDDE